MRLEGGRGVRAEGRSERGVRGVRLGVRGRERGSEVGGRERSEGRGRE